MKTKNINRRDFLSKMAKFGAATIVGTMVIGTTGCYQDNATYSVDPSKCNGCEDCFPACNFGAITISEKATISSSKCVGCGKCVGRCKQGAIS